MDDYNFKKIMFGDGLLHQMKIINEMTDADWFAEYGREAFRQLFEQLNPNLLKRMDDEILEALVDIYRSGFIVGQIYTSLKKDNKDVALKIYNATGVNVDEFK